MSGEVGPTPKSVLACDDELGVGERGVRGWRRRREARDGAAKALPRTGVTGAKRVQKFLGLFAELLQRRTRGQPRGRVGHTISSHEPPASARRAERRSGTFSAANCSGGLGPLRGRGAS